MWATATRETAYLRLEALAGRFVQLVRLRPDYYPGKTLDRSHGTNATAEAAFKELDNRDGVWGRTPRTLGRHCVELNTNGRDRRCP
jgi:hypothetical protein